MPPRFSDRIAWGAGLFAGAALLLLVWMVREVLLLGFAGILLALVFRAPEGLLRADDCLMTADEADALARAIPRARLVTVPGTNHYTVLFGGHPLVRKELEAFLSG